MRSWPSTVVRGDKIGSNSPGMGEYLATRASLLARLCLRKFPPPGRERGTGDPGLRVLGAPDDPAAVRGVREAVRQPGHVHPEGAPSRSPSDLLRERWQQLPRESARHPGKALVVVLVFGEGGVLIVTHGRSHMS